MAPRVILQSCGAVFFSLPLLPEERMDGCPFFLFVPDKKLFVGNVPPSFFSLPFWHREQVVSPLSSRTRCPSSGSNDSRDGHLVGPPFFPPFPLRSSEVETTFSVRSVVPRRAGYFFFLLFSLAFLSPDLDAFPPFWMLWAFSFSSLR